MHRHSISALVAAILLAVLTLNVGHAGERQPYSAQQGLDLAISAASSWAADAQLIYVENDEDVDDQGSSVRWGYLFASNSEGKARGYTIREGKILEAANLDFGFDAPPVIERWVDSTVAFAAAEKEAGAKYRRKHGGSLSSMLLMRGAFHQSQPDMSTWTLVYTSESAPVLWVVVDAREGKVVRTWKG